MSVFRDLASILSDYTAIVRIKAEHQKIVETVMQRSRIIERIITKERVAHKRKIASWKRSPTDERLANMELRYLALQDEVETLSGVVYEQQKRLDVCQAEILSLRESVSGEGWNGAGPQSEEPRHY